METLKRVYEEIYNSYDREDVFDHPSCSFQDLCRSIGAEILSKLPLYGNYTLHDPDGRVRAKLPDGRILTAIEHDSWHGGEHSGHAIFTLTLVSVN